VDVSKKGGERTSEVIVGRNYRRPIKMCCRKSVCGNVKWNKLGQNRIPLQAFCQLKWFCGLRSETL